MTRFRPFNVESEQPSLPTTLDELVTIEESSAAYLESLDETHGLTTSFVLKTHEGSAESGVI